MQDHANELVATMPRPSPRRLLRTTWAGAVAAVTASGLLLAAAPVVPDAPLAEAGRRLPAELGQPLDGRAGTTPQDVTPEQIVAVLVRANRQAREQGPDLSPVVAQAAAELGMLYTTYQMQQLGSAGRNEALSVRDAPARASGPADDAGARGDAVPSAIPVSYLPDGEADGADRDDSAAAGPKDDDPKAADPQADDPEADGTEAAGTEPAETDATESDAAQSRRTDVPVRRVSYHEVVLAAVRLATVLDAIAPTGLVEVEQDARRQDPSALPLEGPRERADRTLRESLLDTVTAFGGSTLGYANGRIPADVLCPLEFDPAHRLRCDAAERLEALSREFEREFGRPIPITDSYRSFVEQIAVASAKPHLAAVPGTSNHGWGLAVDLGAPISSGTSPEYVWLRVHGPDFGWDNPSWARAGGMKPEPWHFEFFAAGPVPNRAIDPSDVGTWGPPASSDPADVVPGQEAAGRDERPKDRPSATEPRQPATQPEREPTRDPAPQKPTKPAPKPKPGPGPKPDPEPTPKPTPSDPNPAKPTPTPTPKPTPTPTPTPTNPTPDPTPSPTPSTPDPTPSEPSQPPSPGASQPTPSTPTPSPAPSTPRSGTPPEQTANAEPSPTTPSPTTPSASPAGRAQTPGRSTTSGTGPGHGAG